MFGTASIQCKYIFNKNAYKNLSDPLDLTTNNIYDATGGYVSIRQLAEITPNEPVKLKDIKSNDIYELFPSVPNVDKKELMINRVGLYCMTKPDAANKIMDILRKYIVPEN